ncbi:hypothetical protein SDC9_135248 [bioreactor metagenome]|uniref:Uncharacterized protein n=1 Tax=bioreactor metagenome TaxID=1076179 RepID=A0A645DFU8_9ZZZZ
MPAGFFSGFGVCESGAPLREKREDIRTEKQYRGKRRRNVQHQVIVERRQLYPQKYLGKRQMAGAADRQKFCKALYETENYHINIHYMAPHTFAVFVLW